MSNPIVAKLRLEELEDGTSGNANESTDSSASSVSEGEGGGGGNLVDGGAEARGGRFAREDEALRTSTSGRVGGGRGVAVLTVDSEERALPNITGDAVEDDAVGEPLALRAK